MEAYIVMPRYLYSCTFFFQLPNMKVNPKGAIRYTTIPKRKHPSGSTPAQITKYNMDSSYQLESFLKQYQKRYGDQVSNSMSDKNQ